MKRESKLTQPMLFLATLLIFLFVAGEAAAFSLLDGKLDIRGSVQQTFNYRTEQDVRDVEISSFRTVGRSEIVFKMLDCPDRSITFHSNAHYFYDAAMDIDHDQRHAIAFEAGRKNYRYFNRPRSPNDWLTEAYLDIKYENFFQLKLGKQLVSWGETAEARVADLINPLDTAYLIAFPDWEDFKVGLWMARFFITPKNLWQDMYFEFLIIPQFVAQRLPPAGSGLFFGSPQTAGSTQMVLDKQRRDSPEQFSLEDSEVGLRIRGHARIGQGVDWALSNFYTRLDSPIIDGQQGFNKLIFMQLGLPVKGKIFAYPHYNSTAFTFATTSESLGSTIKGELVYNTNKKYQYGTYEVKERDLVAGALTISKDIKVPYLSQMNRETAYSCSLTWYQYYMPNFKNDGGVYIRGETGTQSNLSKYALSISTSFFFGTLIPYFNLALDTSNGTSTLVGGATYQPGDHWSWGLSYQQLNHQGIGKYQNQIISSMRYEFW